MTPQFLGFSPPFMTALLKYLLYISHFLYFHFQKDLLNKHNTHMHTGTNTHMEAIQQKYNCIQLLPSPRVLLHLCLSVCLSFCFSVSIHMFLCATLVMRRPEEYLGELVFFFSTVGLWDPTEVIRLGSKCLYLTWTSVLGFYFGKMCACTHIKHKKHE